MQTVDLHVRVPPQVAEQIKKDADHYQIPRNTYIQLVLTGDLSVPLRASNSQVVRSVAGRPSRLSWDGGG